MFRGVSQMYDMNEQHVSGQNVKTGAFNYIISAVIIYEDFPKTSHIIHSRCKNRTIYANIL